VYMESPDQIYGIDSARPLPQIVTEEKDENRHWLRAFAALCKRGNPNAIEWLWAPADRILKVHPLFEELILRNASAFVGLKALTASHFGFAKSQIEKMRPEDFIEDDEEGMSTRMRSKSGKVGAARRDLVEKYGYDTKYASHAARLMLQLEMLVNTGRVIYPFAGHDFEQIMGIKTGVVQNDQIDSVLDDMKARCDEAVTRNAARIPFEPNTDRINEILVSFYQRAFGLD
jgi:hypothetical protein